MSSREFSTEQEEFWAGQFGTDYIERNRSTDLLASNVKFFATALGSATEVGSCIEFGANVGMNLKALAVLYPGLAAQGVEINADAAKHLAEFLSESSVHRTSILDFEPSEPVDLALIKGVLIHLNPEALPAAYDKLVAATRRYLLVAEYYNPTPVAVSYRGHSERLFKRDFAGELMARHPQMHLLDYGFAYHGDPVHPQDDITWFLMEKR